MFLMWIEQTHSRSVLHANLVPRRRSICEGPTAHAHPQLTHTSSSRTPATGTPSSSSTPIRAPHGARPARRRRHEPRAALTHTRSRFEQSPRPVDQRAALRPQFCAASFWQRNRSASRSPRKGAPHQTPRRAQRETNASASSPCEALLSPLENHGELARHERGAISLDAVVLDPLAVCVDGRDS